MFLHLLVIFCVFPCWTCNVTSVAIYSASYENPPANHSQPRCHFNWTNREEMITKIRDRMKYRNKLFLRFHAPVFYPDCNLTWRQSQREVDTWVWVAGTHDYMLHFPHNFNVLSLGTMGIITNDFWGRRGEGRIDGYCSKSCLESAETSTPRCTLTWKDISDVMANVSADLKTDWKYVCFQVNYDVSDEGLDANHVIPDMYYYVGFLSQLFRNRPYLGKGVSKTDFIHYNCFEETGRLEGKELLMNYFVISIIAILLWLYVPLFVYYLPSSEPTWSHYPVGYSHTEFHSVQKSPINFAKFLRCVFGFYIGREKTWRSRFRRFLFVAFAFGLSIRMLYTRYCFAYVCFVVICFVITLIPDFWSVHIPNEQPTHFMDVLEYPEGTFRQNLRKKEYQLLAHRMKERLCLVLDLQFWTLLFRVSWRPLLLAINFPASNLLELFVSFLVSLMLLCFSIFSVLFYHFAPAFYFYKHILLAITGAIPKNLVPPFVLGRASALHYHVNGALRAAVFVFSFLLVIYFMTAMMFVCYLTAEVTMFTYIGAVLDPSMAFRYVSLVGAVSFVLYKLVTGLREYYDKLRDEVVEILEKKERFAHLNQMFPAELFERQEAQDGTLKIVFKHPRQPPKVVLYKHHYGKYLSRDLLHFCIEECDPLRRKVLFMILKVLLMTFYLSVAMWIKNVFHKEKDVSSIFNIIEVIATYFVPNLLQFLADKTRFGKKDSVDLYRDVHEAIVAFVRNQGN